jgi:hypothetical protein
MASLDPTLTAAAVPDVHPEAPQDGADRRDVLLVLTRDPVPLQPALAVRATVRQRCLVGLVDPRRNRATALPTVAVPRLATRPLGLLLPRSARERRRLALHFAARRVEILAQPLDLSPQLLAFPLQVLALSTRAEGAPASRGSSRSARSHITLCQKLRKSTSAILRRREIAG